MGKLQQKIKQLDLEIYLDSHTLKKQYCSIKSCEDQEKLAYVTLMGGIISVYLLLTKKGFIVSSLLYFAKEISTVLEHYGKL